MTPPAQIVVWVVGGSARERQAAARSAGRHGVEYRIFESDSAATLGAELAGTRATHIAILSAPGTLVPGAIETVASALERFPSALCYGDSRSGRDTARRPVLSPLRLRAQHYLGALVVFETAAIREIGGFRAGLDGSHSYDLALRLVAAGQTALHVPQPLTRAPGIRPRTETDLRAVADQLSSLGVDAEVTPARVRYAMPGQPLVSVIIPTRGSRSTVRGNDSVLVVDAVRSILDRSGYQNLEFLIVADDPTPQPVVDELAELLGDRLRLVRWSESFNFSGKMNRGAANASGEYLLMLNDDVELITPDWIETMVGLAAQPGVGMVGAMLYFENDRIQHGGHVYVDHWAGHIGLDWPRGRDDALGSMSVDREVGGVTAACALLPAEAFWRVGGFSTVFAGNYNDVDLSLKLRSAGYSIVWSPHAELYHFESRTRDSTVAPEEIGALRRRWGTRLLLDPYWP